MNKKKKYHLVLDVETIGANEKYIYDIGYAIVDREGNIYEERSYIIREIFFNTSLMDKAYYREKIPEYFDDIATGYRKVITFAEMRTELLAFLIQYNVKVISAYNLPFDMGALKATTQFLNQGKKFLTKEHKNVELLCLWSFACEVLYTPKFQKVAREKGWVTQKGNIQTSAEIGYRFLTGQDDFQEEHKGLDDVKIEIEIMKACYRKKKKHKSGIIPHCWRIPNGLMKVSE